MPDCSGVCTREAEGSCLYSSPLVDNAELLCRNARKPQDTTGAAGHLKTSFIHTRELQAGQLSAWRIAVVDELPALARKLKERRWPADVLLAARAVDIRAIRTSREGRVLCVINDTRIDSDGGHDSQHVAISPCSSLLDAPEELELEMTELKAALKLAFRSSGFSLDVTAQAL